MTAGQVERESGRMARVERAGGLARLAFTVAAWAFLAGIMVQLFLVGIDLFAGGDSGLHRDFAYIYGWLVPILILLATAANMDRLTRGLTVTLLVLFAIQTVLPTLKDTYPVVAALHTPNALAIFALAVVLARRAGTTDLRTAVRRWTSRSRPAR
jgi:hypothetical protein